jgi:hypothetical protein
MTNSNNAKKNRDFGYLFGFIFCFFSGYLYLKNASLFLIVLTFILVGGLFVIGLLKPHLLSPLSNAWYLLGELLGRVVSPIILGIIFFLLITPVAIIGKLLGRDELALKKKSTNSYWIDRQPESITSDSFKNQF